MAIWRDQYERTRLDSSYRPRLIAGSPVDRLRGLEPLMRMAAGLSVLDIACHKGLICYELAKNGAALLHGLDHYEHGVEVARSLHEDFDIPTRFDVLDFRGGAKVLEAWLAAYGAKSYDITLYLGVHHHLQRQMPRDMLTEFVALVMDRCGGLFAVRSGIEQLNEVDALAIKKGLELRHHTQLGSRISPVRIYQRPATVAAGL